ncbi:MAG: hypothetical protein VKQ33_12465 [Candidatus Sericytochromatia bacterium]|nr:hypothetical protein [Candidatus Sericytochromatia bacterium]
MNPQDPVTAALADHVATLTSLAEAVAAAASLPARTLARLVGQPVEGAPERERGLQAHLAAVHHELAEARQALAARGRSDRETAPPAPEASAAAKRQLFRNMESTLLQLPVVRHAVAQGAPTTAGDVLALLEPLEAALTGWGYEPVGQVGVVVPFAPEAHQAVFGAPAPGEAVVVKTPGYRLDGEVLVRARVRPA